jgi:acetyltransferase-like isoleucine patch superfamily enzyme
MNSFYSPEELSEFGFVALGKNVLLSRKASIYGAGRMAIGSHVRIDDFCILSGTIKIGNYVHIAAYTSLCGGGKGIVLEDFVNLSRKIEIFAVSDDFSGATMTNPMVPDPYKDVLEAEVILKKHSLIGAACVVLPGVILEEGSVIGAMSLVKTSTTAWSINAGIPARKINDRQKDLLRLERQLLESIEHG